VTPPVSSTPWYLVEQQLQVRAQLLASHNNDLWHARLDHPGHGQLHRILAKFDFHCSPSEKHSCSACHLGKHIGLPFSDSNSISLFPFQLMHCDVWTSPVVSNSGFKFYLVILDDFSHFAWTFPLHQKSDVLPALIAFHPSFILSFNAHSCAYKLTMARSLITTLHAHSFSRTASSCVSRAPTPLNKMAAPSARYTLSMIACTQCCYMLSFLHHFGLTLLPQRPTCSTAGPVAFASSSCLTSSSSATLQITITSACLALSATQASLPLHLINSPPGVPRVSSLATQPKRRATVATTPTPVV
jgi:hypothetical protein